MPRIIFSSNLTKIPKDFIPKADKFFRELFKAEEVIIDFNTGRALNKAEPNVFTTVMAVGRIHDDVTPRLHRSVADFVMGNLGTDAKNTTVRLVKMPASTLSKGGVPRPYSKDRDNDLEDWQ